MEIHREKLVEIGDLLKQNEQIEFAFACGECIERDSSPNAPIEISCWVKDDFSCINLTSFLEDYYTGKLFKILFVELQFKMLLYFKEAPKIEISFSKKLEELYNKFYDHNFSLEKSAPYILFDKSRVGREYFKNLSITNVKRVGQKIFSNLLDNFLYEFEKCSDYHRRGDGYNFYRAYNKALDSAIKLTLLSKKKTGQSTAQRNFIEMELMPEQQKDFNNLSACFNLHEANRMKRNLLNFFYVTIKTLVPSNQLEEIIQFCENMFTRDFLWNFRDISMFNPRIKPGIIFRTSTLTLIQAESFFESMIVNKKIKTIIDFRSPNETRENGFNEKSLALFSWVQTPIDHISQISLLQIKNGRIPKGQETYYYFVQNSKPAIKEAVEGIIGEKESIAIQCHSGKDRTGYFTTLLHLLSGAPLETVYRDYLSSERDTKKEYLDVVLDTIQKGNGIKNYFLQCGLSRNQILQLKQKILVL